MSIPIKSILWMLGLVLVGACEKEKRYIPEIASVISNECIISITDVRGNNMIGNADDAEGIHITNSNGYNLPFYVKDFDGNQCIKVNFPLPSKSSMKLSQDGLSRFGESGLSLTFKGKQYLLKGLFQHIWTIFDTEMYGADRIDLIEVRCSGTLVSNHSHPVYLYVSLEY